MRKTREIKLRMSEEAFARLNCKVKKSGLSREEFLRRMIAGKEIREAPPINFGLAVRELRRIGTNLNRLLVVAQTNGFADERELRRLQAATESLEERLLSSVLG